MPLRRAPVAQASPIVLEAIGHSVPAAGGSVGGDHNGYVAKLAKLLGSRQALNRAIGGSISCWHGTGASGDGGWGWVLTARYNATNTDVIKWSGQRPVPGPPASGASYSPTVGLSVVHAALNDLGELGSQNPRPMQEAHRTILSRCCAAAVWEDDNAAWVFGGAGGGGWSFASSAGLHSGQVYHSSSTVGATATFTLPASYPGGLVVAIGLVVGPTYDLTVGVKIDGVDQPDVVVKGAQICDTLTAGKFNHLVVRLGRPELGQGLAAGAHTIVLTLKAFTAGGMIVDYAQVEADPSDGPILVLPNPHRCTTYSLWNTWPRGPNAGVDPMNDASVQAWKAAVATVAGEFGKRVVQPDIDAALGKAAANFAADGAHPNNRGHSIIARTIHDAIRASGLLTAHRASQANPPDPSPYWVIFNGSPGPPLQNNWINYGGAYPYSGTYRDERGAVHLRMTVKSGTIAAGTVVVTLPAGYRPEQTMLFPGYGPAGAGAIWQVDPDGSVRINAGGNATFTHLPEIVFSPGG